MTSKVPEPRHPEGRCGISGCRGECTSVLDRRNRGGAMKRRVVFMAAMAALVSVAAGVPSSARPTAIGAVPVVTGLNYPAAFTFAPDGRIFYGERLTGKIRIYDPSSGRDTTPATRRISPTTPARSFE